MNQGQASWPHEQWISKITTETGHPEKPLREFICPRLPNTKREEIFGPHKPTKKTKTQQVVESLGLKHFTEILCGGALYPNMKTTKMHSSSFSYSTENTQTKTSNPPNFVFFVQTGFPFHPPFCFLPQQKNN